MLSMSILLPHIIILPQGRGKAPMHSLTIRDGDMPDGGSKADLCMAWVDVQDSPDRCRTADNQPVLGQSARCWCLPTRRARRRKQVAAQVSRHRMPKTAPTAPVRRNGPHPRTWALHCDQHHDSPKRAGSGAVQGDTQIEL